MTTKEVMRTEYVEEIERNRRNIKVTEFSPN